MSTADGWSKPNFASCVIRQTPPLGALVLYCKVMLCRACVSGCGYGSLTEHSAVSGAGMEVLQYAQKFRVLWHGRTELTEVPGGYKRCCTRTPGIVARSYRSYRSSGNGYECRTELTEVLCTGMDAVQNSQKFRVRVISGWVSTRSRGRSSI